MLTRLPAISNRWLALAAGAASVVLGGVLALKPFSSLDALTLFAGLGLIVTGTGDLMAAERSSTFVSRLTGVLLIVTGIAALLLHDHTIRTIAIVVAAGLIFSGLSRVASVLRGPGDERAVDIAGGLATTLLGVVALAWRDVTILVIALLVAPVAIIFGFGQLLRAARMFRGKNAAASAAPSDRRRGFRRGLRVLRASVSLLLALALVGLSAFLHRGSPAVSAFYDAPSTLPTTPGQLVRSDPFERGLPANARAVRILYTTTALDGSIGVASGLVIIPTTPAKGDWPVLLWEHGTTGIARQCAPSLLDDPLGAGAMPAQQESIDHGWVVVAPDYIGLGTEGPHPYLIGIPVATSSLDAVRAARQIAGLALSDKTVVWGHSQGGGAALWVGIEAKRYAPDVPLLGVAALAPASDLPAFAGEVEQNPAMQLFASYIIDAYSQVYPDVRFDDYIRLSARTVVRSMASRCLSEPAMLLSLGAILPGESMISRNPTDGALGVRLRENVPNQTSGIPTFLGQGLIDSLIEPETQARFVAGLCAQGQVVEYHTYANRDHLGVVADDSPLIPDLLTWTEARFAGQPSATVCSTTKE